MDIIDAQEEFLIYPTTPTGLKPEAAAIDPEVVWSRIFSYIKYRWGSTLASWEVKGDGDFVLPLRPAQATALAYWNEGEQDWISVTYRHGSHGVALPSEKQWRVSATCGGEADAPKPVQEAYRRLANYLAADADHPPGVESITSGALSLRFSRDRAGRALQNSGAADLLRPYRRLGA